MRKFLILSLLFLSLTIIISLISIKDIEAVENIILSNYVQDFKTNETTRVTDLENVISLTVPKSWLVLGKWNFMDKNNIIIQSPDALIRVN